MSSPNGMPAHATGGAAAAQRTDGGWGLPLLVLIIGMFMSVLDTSIVNVAIPTIQNEFGGTTDDAQWVVTGYTLTLGVVVPITAWLGDRLGLKQLYNVALLAFAAGSALCGLAGDLNSLVIFRILQAIPGGILPVITLAILLRIVPPRQLGAAMGLYGLGIVFAPGVGPVLGGYLVEYVNWRLIFYINVPIGILGAVAATLVLPQFARIAGRRFDVLGFLTVGGGLFALLLATSEGESWGWSSYPILALIIYGVLSLALFVVIELEVGDPLLDIRIFRYSAYTNSLMLIAVLMIVMYGILFYIPQFLQQAQGWGAFDAGLTLLPQALVMAVLMPVAGRIYDRIGPRWPAAAGLIIVTTITYLLHTISLDTPRVHVMWLMLVLGIGLGLAFMPIFTGGVAVIPMNRTNAASALNNVVQRVSGAIGLAVLTAILTSQRAQQMTGRAALLPATTPTPHLGGPSAPDWLGAYALYRQTQQQVFVGAIDDLFLISAGLSALAVLAALLLRSGPAPAHPATAGPPAQLTRQDHAPPSTITTDNGSAPALVAPDHHPACDGTQQTPGPAELAGSQFHTRNMPVSATTMSSRDDGIPIAGWVAPWFGPVREVFAGLFASGQETGAALTVIRRGQPVIELHGGWVDQARTVPWDARSVVNTFSVSKALIAFALLVAVDRERIGLDEPVSRYWPEFARHGKERITLRQVLSHQAALPAFPRRRAAEAAADWSLLVGDLADAAPEWAPGTAHAEHAWTYGHLVGELIRRIDGRTPGRFLRQEVAQPWSLDVALGLDDDAQRHAAELEYGDPDWARRMRGTPGSLRERAVTNPAGWLELPVLNSPLWRSAEVPAANIHATATGCARFYAGLLAGGELDGVRLISRDLAAQMCRVHAAGRDLLLDRPVNWGLGVQVDLDLGEIGMGGISGCYACAHPGLSYSFAFLTRRLHDHQRVVALIDAVNACLS